MIMKVNDSIINNMCKNSGNGMYLSLTLSIIFLILIIVSLNNLEKSKCKCSDIPEKRFLREWFIFMIIMQSLFIFFFLIGKEPCYVRFLNNYYLYIISMIFGIINIVMLIRLILYLRILRNNCPCGYGNIEKFLFWLLVIQFSIIALFLLIIIIMAIATAFMFIKK